MSDRLTEAIYWVECELRPYEGHPDLLPEPAKLVLDAAREHLSCGTVTDEMVEAACNVRPPDLDPGESEGHRFERWMRAALEAALGVRERT